jgi:N-acetylmuramoyl-L-alanine amidase
MWLIFLISMILVTSMNSLPLSAQSSPLKTFTVTIDAGHGGHDTGAPGKKSVEKNIALEIALKLGHYIESLMEDVNVYYTRKTDIFIPLYERAPIANRNKSDLFISIHVNAVRNRTTPTGTSTYVMGFSKSAENLDLVMQENKAMLLEKDYLTNYQGFDPTQPESYIIFNNVQNNNLTQSLEIATIIQDQLRTRAQRKDNGVHQGNLAVLWKCAKPSVLIETGFISNPQEEEFLMTDNGQDIIASAIYMAVRQYKESVDLKSGVAARSDVPNMDAGKRTIEVDKKPEVEVKKPAESIKTTIDNEKKTGENDMKTGQSEKKTGDSIVKARENETLIAPQNESDVEFRIQILASVKKLPPGASEFKGQKNLKEIEADGFYKYLSPPVKTYQEALELRRQLGASFHGAFIVGFKNGVRIPVNSFSNQRKK